MLLQRIRLKGFLGHRGSMNGDDGDGFVEVDFSTAPLWLIHGPNGGGKSSLWDAVTFALFKKHRASGTDGGKNLKHLVHDECAKAEVVVEFDLDGQSYRVCGEVLKPKRKNGSANTSRIVQRRNGEGWQTIAEGEQKVEDCLANNLRMSFETFTSAVLLRQGEADTFLKAKAKDRRARLMELLQLDFYRKLGALAESRRLERRRSCGEIEKTLEGLPRPSEEDLAAQQALIENLRVLSGELETRRKNKEEEERNAQRANTLLEQIGEHEAQWHKDRSLFDQTEQIENSVRRFYELRDVLLRLDNLWAARHQLEVEETRLKDDLRNSAEIEARLKEGADRTQQKRNEEGLASESLQRTKDALEQAQRQRDSAALRAGELKIIEGLEQEIAEEEEKLSSYKPLLYRREEIEHASKRYEELREAVPLLRTYASSTAQSAKAQLILGEKEAAVARIEGESNQATDNEEKLQLEGDKAEADRDLVRTEYEACRSDLKLWRDKVKRRDEVSGEEECSYCGSVLNSDDAKGRLAAEHERWHAEISHFEGEETRIRQLLEEKNRSLDSIRKKKKAAAKASRDLSSQLEGARRDLAHATITAQQALQDLDRSLEAAGGWATQLNDLTLLEEEFIALGDVPSKRLMLNEALVKETEVNAAISVHRKRLLGLPSLSLAERKQIAQEMETWEQRTLDCEVVKSAAEVALQKVSQELGLLTEDHLRLHMQTEAAQRTATDQQHRVHAARRRFEHAAGEVQSIWLGHPACEDERAFSTLKDERDSLCNAEAQAQELSVARERKSRLEGSISTLRKQFDAIPKEHRRPVEQVREELAMIKEEIALTAARLREADIRLTELQQQREAIETKQAEMAEAEKELNYFNLLAEALGKSGLEAVIVRKAQEEIRQRANATLIRLSGGCLEIDLEDKVDSEELQIQARDLKTGSLRLFEYLSGGEKFRVAISLAVAIGQTIGGGRAAETLVIDEGFGALDEVNRGRLVEELSRLSDIVLCGGRIVIVSHQDDVCDEFTHRYRITKDNEGYVNIDSGGAN